MLMKITPIEIRQKTFAERMLRGGYDKEEVSAFLQSLSQEWERVQEENRDLRIKLEVTQKEVQKLRDVESSLYRTLKTAEDTSAQLIEQANRSADLQMREAKNQAESIVNEARNKADKILQEANNQSRMTLEEALSELKVREGEFRQLEMLRESLLKEIRHMATDTLDRINRVAEKGGSHIFEEKIREVRQSLSQKNQSPTTLQSDAPADKDTPTASFQEKILTEQAMPAAEAQVVLTAKKIVDTVPAPAVSESVITKPVMTQEDPISAKPAGKAPSSFFDEI